jgi:hypothetical protein
MAALLKKALPAYTKLAQLETLCRSFVGQTVQIQLTFMGRQIQVINTNIVGDLLEDVFYHGGLKDLGDFEEGPLQASPDFYAEDKTFLFEQKVYAKTPGFDISNYSEFVDTMAAEGGVFKKLFRTKYIVFEYEIVPEGVRIKTFSLLNIWQLPNYTGMNPLSVQNKRGVWYNLRPQGASSWSDATKTPARFVEALKESIRQCPNALQDKEAKLSSIDAQWQAIQAEYAV